MSEPDSRKLADLRVVQLRTELEKRGLDKTGVKQILVERLQKALIDEGLDPEVYQFDMTDKKQKAPSASNNPENEDEINDDTIEKEGEQAEKKEEGQEIKEATNDDAKKVAETDTEAKAEQKDQDENKEKNQENKEESPIQLTIEEEEVLQDNDAENGDNAAKENASNTDEKKSTKDAPETSKDTSEINPAQQDAKKDEKTTGENRLVFHQISFTLFCYLERNEILLKILMDNVPIKYKTNITTYGIPHLDNSRLRNQKIYYFTIRRTCVLEERTRFDLCGNCDNIIANLDRLLTAAAYLPIHPS